MDTLFRIDQMRRDYAMAALDVADTAQNPIEQFGQWFTQATLAQLPEPNAMTLATVNKQGQPSARVVLLKGFDQGGFTFFTNKDSRKGQELAQNPAAALCFNWLELERQVRICGHVEHVSEEEATAYFQSRPKTSQIGAWVSAQSSEVASRALLENRFEDLSREYACLLQLPKPEFWGGYRLIPHEIEFWQGRSSRLHDRILYQRHNDQSWSRIRLAP
jgi:pyridoxamine 5'-phosphate oxidase